MPTIADVDRVRHLRFRRDSGASTTSNNSTTSSNSSSNTDSSLPQRRRRDTGGGDGEGEDDARRKRLRESLPSTTNCMSSSSCSAANCVKHFAYSEVLLQPQLLFELRTEEEVHSSNPLLEFCLDGGFKTPSKPTAASSLKRREFSALHFPLPDVLRICSARPFSQEKVEELRELLAAVARKNKNGCDQRQYVNVPDSKGQTPMHLLIQGCTKDSFYCTLQAIYLLLSSGADPTLSSSSPGETPFTALRALLARDLVTECVVLAHLLIRHRQQSHGGPAAVQRLVNAPDADGRTLLTHSAAKGDAAADLTRLLLNSGARVWPEVADREEDVAVKVQREMDGSALGWFLRSLLARRGTDHLETLRQWGDETLFLLGHAAASKDSPEALRDHLTRVVLRIGRSERCEGPVFAEVRRRLAPLWAQPLSLKFLCLRRIRGAVAGRELMADAAGDLGSKLDIPNTMLQYLQLG